MTDSSYFSCMPVLENEYFKQKNPDFIVDKDSIIELYDRASENVNATFAEFMDKSFNTTLENGAIIKAGREIAASTGFFIKKKKYACLLYEKDGFRLDKDGKPGKLKVMGMDMKRADTQKIMQKFLEKILMDILTGKEEDNIIEQVKNFRDEYKKIKPHEMGLPRKANNITLYLDKMNKESSTNIMKLKVKEKKLTVPGQVRASMNWNKLLDVHHDKYSPKITDGGKVVVCYLKKNVYNITSVAYPFDIQDQLPPWFYELPLDVDLMVETAVDKKIKNMLYILGWDLQKTKNDTHFDSLFEF